MPSPGATIISCFVVRILKKVRSFVGSRSLTVHFALFATACISPAYCTVVALSRFVRIGIPELKVNNNSKWCSSPSGLLNYNAYLPG